MSKHHNAGGSTPPAPSRTRNPKRPKRTPTEKYAVLAVLVDPAGAVHCTLNLVDPVSRLILLAGAMKYPTWAEFFADPASVHLARSARRWHVKPATPREVPFAALPSLTSNN